MLPDSATDERAESTALAVAIGGIACPVPFLMSVAAVRMAGGGHSRRARLAVAISVATMIGQVAVIALLIAGVIP